MARVVTTNVDPLLLDHQICFALYRASRAIIRAYGPLLKPLALTYPQYLVMLVLWESDGLPVKGIGDRLDLDSATLTPLLKKLESQKLLSRKRSTDDERVVRVFLTNAGKQLKEKATSIPTQLACKGGFDIQNKNDRATIVRLRSELNRISEHYLAP